MSHILGEPPPIGPEAGGMSLGQVLSVVRALGPHKSHCGHFHLCHRGFMWGDEGGGGDANGAGQSQWCSEMAPNVCLSKAK